jgi:hypothetical protein
MLLVGYQPAGANGYTGDDFPPDLARSLGYLI